MNEKIYLILFFMFGTFMGSFYHVVATRVSNGKSIVSPRSHCDNCGHILKWYELIPIISYIIQRGKCSKCKVKLSLSYLLMEICTGLLFSVSYHVFDFGYDLIIALIFISSLIIIIISDIEYMIILDEVLIFASLGIIITMLFGYGIKETCYHILYGILSFGTMLLIKKMGDMMFKQESLGGGDIKLMFLIGLVLGFSMSICNIFFATFIAFPVALSLLVLKKDNIIPFGPFLSMAAIILFISNIDLDMIINFILY